MSERATEPLEAGAATWLGFVLMCLGMFMAILDIQVVATSLPAIQDALAISREAMSWIQTAYLIAEIIAIPLTGLADARADVALAVRGGDRALYRSPPSAVRSAAISRSLISFRVLQGFAGGTLIPAVFSAVFLLFPIRLHPVATTMAGIMAVLAPTVGPVVGGWITETWSWHWLFLINVAPGIIAAAATPFLLPRTQPRFADLVTLDGISLALMAIALACLETRPEAGPARRLALATLLAAVFAQRRRDNHLRDQNAEGGASRGRSVDLAERAPLRSVARLSFCLGVGLFGSVYLMPVFLAYVRRHDAFEIGTIMLVTGVAQLVTAPIAGSLESRFDPRWLSAAGFALFALGLGCSALQSRVADFDEMFWPQVLRGVAIMFCLLPPTRLALGALSEAAGARCQRPVQSDAQPRRRDRHRLDRYHSLRPHRRTRRSPARPADRGRRHGGAGDRA